MSFWLGVLIFAARHPRLGLPARGRPPAHRQAVRHEGDPVLRRLRPDAVVVPPRARPSTASRRIPAGGFVKIVGMTPLEDVAPADQHRAFWRFPLWQRTIVLVAGSATHFVLAVVIFYVAALTTGLPTRRAVLRPDEGQAGRRPGRRVRRRRLDLTKDGGLRACRAGDPVGPAQGRRAAARRPDRRRRRQAGRDVRRRSSSTSAASPPGPVEITYVRDGERRTHDGRPGRDRSGRETTGRHRGRARDGLGHRASVARAAAVDRAHYGPVAAGAAAPSRTSASTSPQTFAGGRRSSRRRSRS